MAAANQKPDFAQRLAVMLQHFHRRIVLVVLACILVLIVLWGTYLNSVGRSIIAPASWGKDFSGGEGTYHAPPPHPDAQHQGQPPPKPAYGKTFEHQVDLPKSKVIGLIFFGRREMVRVLDCYLKRNLKSNGGALDEVIFVVNTEKEQDLDYLEELLLTETAYSKFEPDDESYLGMWASVKERDTVYIKIDDDVVYFEDNTISALANRLDNNPDYFAVSANVVNNPAMSWVHAHMGVYFPYWPEMTKPSNNPPVSWRASELPAYKGPATGPPEFNIDGTTPAPFKGHRWLPVPLPQGASTYDMTDYPVSFMTYDGFGPSLTNWAAAAQAQYSFLQHLEQNTTYRYKFDLWDYQFHRLSINFFAIRGRDILDAFPFPTWDDEEYLTVARPKELRRHVIMDGTGIAVHFAFGAQYRAHNLHGIYDTDLLDRYRTYANEMICVAPIHANGTATSTATSTATNV